MTILVRRRLSDGSHGPLEKVFEGKTDAEKIDALEKMNKALMLTVTDLFEENLELRELNRNVMLVVTDLYEAVYLSKEGETE